MHNFFISTFSSFCVFFLLLFFFLLLLFLFLLFPSLLTYACTPSTFLFNPYHTTPHHSIPLGGGGRRCFGSGGRRCRFPRVQTAFRGGPGDRVWPHHQLRIPQQLRKSRRSGRFPQGAAGGGAELFENVLFFSFLNVSITRHSIYVLLVSNFF